MDFHHYLERIGYDRPVRLDVETLFSLHRTHLLTVPFENLDIHLGNPIHLDKQSLWNKIIVNQRGGFCYELNGIFAWLLKEIGFDVTYLNGRVYNQAGKRGRAFDHLTLLVRTPNIESAWLADVGFGDSFFEPLKLDFSKEQVQGSRTYRLAKVVNGIDLLKQEQDGEWIGQYFFDLQSRNFPADYESSCEFHQTSPKSSFTHDRLVSLATPEGRITLTGKNLIITTSGKRIKRQVNGDEEFQELLKYYFGIETQA